MISQIREAIIRKWIGQKYDEVKKNPLRWENEKIIETDDSNEVKDSEKIKKKH